MDSNAGIVRQRRARVIRSKSHELISSESEKDSDNDNCRNTDIHSSKDFSKISTDEATVSFTSSAELRVEDVSDNISKRGLHGRSASEHRKPNRKVRFFPVNNTSPVALKHLDLVDNSS